MDNLILLADLIKKRNTLETEIAKLIGRPAAIGHLGEYIASTIFNIALEESASRRAIDGRFRDGSVKGRSVNIKWYAMHEGLLDITPDLLPDYYLVLTGPRSLSMTSRGRARPWLIEAVYLFDSRSLNDELLARGVKRGVACSVAKPLWNQAEVYPNQKSTGLVLSRDQREQIMLFGTGPND